MDTYLGLDIKCVFPRHQVYVWAFDDIGVAALVAQVVTGPGTRCLSDILTLTHSRRRNKTQDYTWWEIRQSLCKPVRCFPSPMVSVQLALYAVEAHGYRARTSLFLGSFDRARMNLAHPRPKLYVPSTQLMSSRIHQIYKSIIQIDKESQQLCIHASISNAHTRDICNCRLASRDPQEDSRNY